MEIEELRNLNWIDLPGKYLNPPNEVEWVIYQSEDVMVGTGASTQYYVPGWYVGEVKDTWKARSWLSKYLIKHGRSIADWYSRFILNLPSKPQCALPGCTRPAAFDKPSHGGFYECCCFDHAQSLRLIRSWRSSDYRTNWMNKYSTYLNSDHFKQVVRSNAYKKFLSKGDSDETCYFYIATIPGRFKYGVTKYDDIYIRSLINKGLNGFEYQNYRVLLKSTRKIVATIEYLISEGFNLGTEYIEFNTSNLLKFIEYYKSALNRVNTGDMPIIE